MTSHELARMLLNGPELPAVYMDVNSDEQKREYLEIEAIEVRMIDSEVVFGTEQTEEAKYMVIW